MPTYLGALIFGLPVWLILFLHRKDLRHKMIYMSLLVMAVAPVDIFFIPSYWHPTTLGRLFGLPIDVFTLLFGFVMGGISAVLYEEFIRRTAIRNRKRHHPLKILICLGPLLLIGLEMFTTLNFMYSVIIATAVMILIILFIRHDLLFDTLFSGLFFASVYTLLLSLYIFIFPEVLKAWNLVDFPQVVLFNVPHYEIIWAFASGAFLGPFYEFSHELVLRKYPNRKR